MNNHQVIALYETVAEITDQMLAAARSGDWEQLAVLETDCARHVEILKTDPPKPLSGEIRVRKVQIINKILADDREIRNIAEPWMAKLAQMINSTGAERKLSQAYGVGLNS
ncbi:MAG: flagellar protein FliT [Pseudomonadota bacterium]